MYPSGIEGEGYYVRVGVVYGGIVSACVVGVCGVWVGGREVVVLGRGCCVLRVFS